ncbi:ABC transporter permease [Saccharomonospora sp. NPDC046836]|uniref:ABC transporter permease n=1 Tax=Saccharomonospora sp. NPDC046836 TaxID=3156921 RepID=UPI0034049099
MAMAIASTTSARRRRRSRDWQLVTSAAVIAGFVVLAVGGLFLQETANRVDVSSTLLAPGPEHWFGTDNQGRDVFARVAVGAGISMISASTAVGIGAAVGLLIALACGLGPRWLDALLMRLCDGVLAFPQLLLALAVSMALGASLVSATIGIVITVIPIFARTLRAEALRSRSEPFIEAARTIGLTTPHIAVRHVVPYVSTTLTIQVAANFGSAVLTLAALSFIGVGAQPPTAEWGAMITDGLQNALTGQWWIGVMPGAALLALVAALNVLADSLSQRTTGKR